jgi:hypothetical protein
MEDNVDYGHWVALADRPPGAMGFVYYISNNATGRHYIGKKNLISYTTLPPLPGKKRRLKAYKESDWKTYRSSCADLRKDITRYGEECFSFIIYEWCFSRSQMTYRETQDHWAYEVLARDVNEDGERVWYNAHIGAVKFLKPE